MSFADWYKQENNKKKKKKETSDFERWYNNSETNTTSKKENSGASEFERWYNENKGTGTDDDDIAPVLSSNRTSGGSFAKEDKPSWFQSGAFDDGYQFGDVSKSIIGTLTDVSENVTTAVFDATENLIDTTAYGVGAIGGLFNKDFKDDVGDFISKEILQPTKTGEVVTKYTNPIGWINELVNDGETEENSWLGDKADGLVQSGAHLAGTFALQAVGVPSWLTMGVNAFGSETESAFQQDATFAEAGISGGISAAAEIVFERISSGVKFKGGTLDDGFQKWLTNNISNKIGRTVLKYATDMVGEGTEEVLTEATSALGRKLTYASEKEWNELLSSEDAFDAFIGGAVMSGVLGGGRLVKSASDGTDFTSGLTANEEKVVKKIYEDTLAEKQKDGTKLSTSEKNKIYDSIVDDMSKGRLNIDDIESVLGGDTYKTYQDVVNSEDAILKEFEELGNKQNPTLAEQSRYNELKAKVDEINTKSNRTRLKNQLSEEVFSLVQGDKTGRLAESYREVARKGQAFEADLTKYKGKQKEAVQRAINSGVLNNTYRSHELVDILSKIEADKGIVFDYTDNAKLKESGFAVEGKTVNGYVTTDSTITLNVQSAKSWQSVVGHEITHVLEGTDAYSELQNALYAYAESKGVLASKKAALTEIYSNMDADIDAELTADLVGDYLFTDKNFITHLTTNRNLFQRIYDEIKYLCKVATGKELTEIEKVKREFDKAWKELNVKDNAKGTDTKYSVSADSNGTELSPAVQKRFSNSKAVDENGNLKVLYHGTYGGEFYIFDKAKGDVEGNFGSGFYFTDNEYDVERNYEGGGPDFENKVARRAEQIESEEEIDYSEAEARARKELFVGSNKHEVYLNIENPAIVGKTTLLDYESFAQEYDIDDYESEEDYESDVEYHIADEIDTLIWEVEKNVDVYSTDGLSEVLWNAVNEGGIDVEQLKADINNLYLEDSNGNFVGNEVTRQIIESLGYDGIIDNTVSSKFSNMGLDEGTTHYIVFKPNQIKSIDNQNPTDNPDIRYSLSEDSEGIQLSKEQSDYFKDSKIKDGKGKLKVVYHGTPNTFYTFRKGDIGYHFGTKTQAQVRAGKKSNLLKCYLNITNPITLDYDAGYWEVDDINSNILVNLVEAGYLTEEERLSIFLGEKYRNTEKFTKKLKDLLISKGYDGIVYRNYYESNGSKSYIVFDSNQAKLTTNVNPTSNPDIRYSISEETDAQYQKAVESGDTETAQRLVDEAAKNAGYSIKAYHGTGYDFTVFDKSKQGDNYQDWGRLGKGFYFAPTAREAETWAEHSRGVKNNVMSVYLRSENMLDSFEALPDDLKDTIPTEWEGLTRRLAEKYVYNYVEYMQEFGYNVQDILKSKGYDGINGHVEFVIYDPEQVKSADAITYDDKGDMIPLSQRFNTSHDDIRYSLSNEGEQIAPVGNYNTPLNSLYYNRDIAPVKSENQYKMYENSETAISEAETVAPVVEDNADTAPIIEEYSDAPDSLDAQIYKVVETLESIKDEMEQLDESYPFHGDPEYKKQHKLLTEFYDVVNEEYNRLLAEANRDSERFESLTDADVPPEMVAPYYGENGHVTIEDPFEKRGIIDVGNRRVKAYMYENPEVKPFFQDEASSMLYDLNNSKKGERFQKEDGTWTGVKRHTTSDIAILLDSWGYTRNQIEAGLNAIIEDNGKENNAVSKRIEFMLDSRLRNGYETVDGYHVPANQDYINLMAGKGWDDYYSESFDNLVRNADKYVPFEDGIAPMKDASTTSIEQEIDVNFDGEQGTFEGFEAEQEAPETLTRSKLHSNIVENIKSVFSSKGFNFDEVLKRAKNLSTFSTVDNIPQRVMEKALGYKEGQVLSDLTVNKVAQNETKGIKWLDFFTNRKSGLLAQISKQYGIKPGSKESAAAQMYAEGFYVDDNNDIVAYGDAELAQDFSDVRVRNNIKRLAQDSRIRQIYDETLSAINESRRRNAYPEIPRLDNYFLHFRAMDDTFSRLGLPFNPNDIRAKDLPTDLNGVTTDLKPGQPYFASAMHRKGKRTSFDLLGGLERYLTSAKNQIYHIDDIQTLRALRNYIADTYGQANGLENIDMLTEEEVQERIEQVYSSHLSTFAKFLNEEANVLAGKTALIDRGIEGIIGRRGITFLDTVNKQVGSNMVGFNISSSLTNFLPVAQTFAKTNKFDFLRAFTQTVSNKVGSLFGKGDSFAEDSPVIIRRKGADRFYRTPFQKVGDAGYVLMSAVDDISTELIARTKYNELTRKGMDSQKAHFETDKWVSRLMGDRSLGQQPQLYNSKMLGIFTKFQLEVRNQLDSQFYDTIQEAKVANEDIENALARNAKTAAKVTSTFVQLAVAQHLFGKAFEAIAGYNPAFDIISVLATMFGFDDDEESEDTVLDNVEQGFLELLEDLPYTSTFTGGRIPISSALPVEQFITGKDDYGNEKSRVETFAEAAPYYVLPTGYGQLKKTKAGLEMFSDEHPVSGSYTDSGNLRFPVEDTPINRVQAGLFGQYASENAREYFDNGYAPLKEKQIQEYVDVELPIADYWEYREGLKGLKTNAEKADYINSLDIADWQKNLLMNNILDRKEDVDMSDYNDYSNWEEFDYAQKNPEKYAFAKSVGGYDAYKSYSGELYDIKADKDENGKSISGSRKAKVLDYINNLDADYGTKIILWKSEYPSDDTYNEDIINYLNEREDITYEEMVTILTELDFKVEGDTVYWD